MRRRAAGPGLDHDRRGHRHRVVHQRHHRSAQSRSAAPPTPRVVRLGIGGVHAGVRRRCCAGERAAVPRGRHRSHPLQRLRRTAGRATSHLRRRRLGCPRPGRVGDQRHGGPDHVDAYRRIPRFRGFRRSRATYPAVAFVRRRQNAASDHLSSPGAAPNHRLRERLRANRDQFNGGPPGA